MGTITCRMRGTGILAVLALLASFAASTPAKAATGDQLTSFDAAVTAGIPGCASGIGTGIAYDGTSLILSCWGSNVLQRVDAVTHLSHGPLTIAGISDLGALAWDGRRQMLWACAGRNSIARIDLASGALDPSFTPIPVPECVDGLAYDGNDDTLWASPDVSSTVYHYALDGTLLGSFSIAGKLGSCGNSGIAVGGPMLYLANNGCSEIYEVAKDFSTSTRISTFSRRLEDLECDSDTFPGKGAIWSVDAYDRILNAWEIPAGACTSGGGYQDCPDIELAVLRPENGRLYRNDVDTTSSGVAEPVVFGSPLTVEVSTTLPGNTGPLEIFVDGTPAGTDPAPPFSVTATTSSLLPGRHTISAQAGHLTGQWCRDRVEKDFLVPDPSVRGSAEGVFAATNIPAEPQILAGGSAVGKTGGSDEKRIVDQPLAAASGLVGVIQDRSKGSTGTPFYAQSDSVLTDVSLLGGLLRAGTLHARARADLNPETISASATGDGSEIANLRIGNTPVVVSQPNTVVALPRNLGRVVLQETVVDTAGTRAEVTVNALHAFLDTPSFKGEVVLGSAYAAVNFAADTFAGPYRDLIHRVDDAGTDADAGGTAATASPLAPGTYSGSLTPGDDSDFYSFQTLQGERIEVAVKPAEREVLTLSPLPQAPPQPTVPGVFGFAFDAVGAVAAVGPDTPDFNLYLYDPAGNLRVSSELPTSAPERAELNADMPYDPPGARGTWTVEVRRAAGSPDGFYSLDLNLLPEELLDQNDALIPGDAPDDCTLARALPVTPTHDGEIDHYAFPGVIRDADQADFFSFPAGIGQLVTVALKPDELADGADLDLYLYGPAIAGGEADCSSPITRSQLGKFGAKALPDAVVQLPAQVTGDYILEVRRYNAVANYYVDLTVANPLPTIPDNDAGTGADAADSCLAPTSMGPGAYEGRLADTPKDDLEDWYSFSVQAGQDITASLKPSELSDFDLELYSACGIPAGDQYTVNHQPMSVPETVHLANAAAGAYLLRAVRNSGGGNYLLGLVLTP